MSSTEWKEIETRLGAMGRKNGQRVDTYADLSAGSGIFRPEGSTVIIEARQYLIDIMKSYGLEVYYDQVGNLFGRRPGGMPQAKAVCTGSHIDTVLNSGQLDGAYGIIAGLEVMRRLQEQNFQNLRPVELAIFMGEEGSSFQESLLGSSVLCGMVAAEDALQMSTREGVSLRELVQQTCHEPIRKKLIQEDTEYFIEAHIEQGGVLESENMDCGCVSNIVGLSSIQFEVIGEENHAGTTPMRLRKEAAVVMAETILYAHHLATEYSLRNGSAVVAADTLTCTPNSYSVIPHSIRFSLDIRDIDWESILEMEQRITAFAEDSTARYGVKLSVESLSRHVPCALNPEIQSHILNSANNLGISCLQMNSGAIHDSLNLAGCVKTGMLFVPSKNGRSHSPFEWTEWEDQARGIDVLEDVIKQLSRKV